jgi:hypothetical protein
MAASPAHLTTNCSSDFVGAEMASGRRWVKTSRLWTSAVRLLTVD